jgi:hypothetical protein
MERNWYVLCTKTKQEKKATAVLTKKGIESFCPYTYTEKKYGTKSITEQQPLFNSFVFAFIAETEIKLVKQLPCITSLAYWKSTPVTVSKQEIDAIRLMASNYINIKLEKCSVSIGKQISYVEETVTGIGKNFISIKPRGLKINLPSLGYTIVAERQKIKTGTQQTVQRKFSLAGFFLRRQGPALSPGQ